MAVLQRVLLAVASAVLLVAAAVPVIAADLQWSAYGTLPLGNATFSLAQDPNTPAHVWAATMGSGLQRTDDGKTWVPAGNLPARLWRITIDPSQGPSGPAPMYVGSAGQGFFKSLDGGKTWQGSVDGLTTAGARNVRAIAMGVNQLLIGTSDGAYKSADGGRTWQAAGLAGYDISAMTFARYAGPPTILASIDGVNNPGSRVVLTKDAGANWAPIKQGLPADLVISSMAVGPLPNGALQRPLFLAGSAGVFKSDDGGQSWGQLSGLPPQGYGSLALSPGDPQILYVGSDGGGGGNGGVWRSTDRGGNWTQIINGLTEHGVTAVAVGRDNPATVLAAAWNPDKPLAPVFELSDTQATPQAKPEDGVCPEPACKGGTIPIASAAPTTTVPTPSPTPCVGPGVASPSPRLASPAPSAAASDAPAPSPSSVAGAQPCPSPSRAPTSPPHSDIPLPVAVGVVVVLGVLLVGSIVITRLRG
ncbi:MAG: WD40/YVTN/BNR-like repeat-containing protein [Candidatus Dormibacteria bacterium]